MPRHVTIEQRGDVALVRIDRPPANALDRELLADGAAALDELRDPGPGAAVIVGRERFFSAGVDLKLAPMLDRDGQREMVSGINRLFAGWYSFERPVVCAVNGHAIPAWSWATLMANNAEPSVWLYAAPSSAQHVTVHAVGSATISSSTPCAA